MVKDDFLREVEALALAKQQQEQQETQDISTRFQALMQEKKQGGNPFPTDALPKRLGDIAKVFNTCYGLPIDYYGLGMLTAASIAIGNAYVVRYKYNQCYPPMLYSAIVGNSSIGKTPAIMHCLAPIFDLEDQYRHEYDGQIQAWKQDCFELQVSGMKREDPPKPLQRELIINDATSEAITIALSHNPRGLLLFQDELNAWIKSQNQYRKGSDGEFWLSVWSNQSRKVSRVGKDPLYAKNPFVSVIGGVQPSILNDFAGEGRAENGYLARILFAWPDEMKKPHESDNSPDQEVFAAYREIIKRLHKLPHNFTEEGFGEAIQIGLTSRALVAYKRWHRDNTDQINAEESDVIKSILGKMEQYLLRLALIISLLDLAIEKETWTEEELTQHQIGEDEVIRAMLLIGYFKKTAMRVIGSVESPVKKLSPEKEAFYEALPEEFSTKSALEAGEKADISERTIKRMLNDFTLFRQLGRGRYRKVYV